MHHPESTLENVNGAGAPHHGDPGVLCIEKKFTPPGLTIAISRETGARGATIGKRISKKLGWSYYDQELLQYLAQGNHQKEDVFAPLSSEARTWLSDQLARLTQEGRIGRKADELEIARIILAIGAKGKAILVGRAAGAILPAGAVLHVRIVAPLHDRIAWIRQIHRFTSEQATDYVVRQDKQRTTILDAHLRKTSSKDAALYDLILNSSRLGEQGCAQLIIEAARLKQAQSHPIGDPPSEFSVEALQ